MRAQAWRDMLIAAVRNSDDSMLECLVAHLGACERAGQMLHAHGCGPGQPMDQMVRKVLHLSPAPRADSQGRAKEIIAAALDKHAQAEQSKKAASHE